MTEMDDNTKYFYNIAEQAVASAKNKSAQLDNIDARWVFCQFAHETGYFTSELMKSNHNLGGLCQTEPNSSPQPDGEEYYMEFNSFEDYANYFGRYLWYYIENGIDLATNLEAYVTALHNGGYFTDSLTTYINGTQAVYNEYFKEEE